MLARRRPRPSCRVPLFLHAETLFESGRREIPRTVGGSIYDITGLVGEQDVPRHVQLVWQGVNDRAGLAAFLGSTIHWGECNLRRDPLGRAVLRREPFRQRPRRRRGEDLLLPDCLRELARTEKSLVVDLEDAELLDEVLAALSGFPPERLCFNASIENLGEQGFRRISGSLPGATLQCPIDFLCPMLLGAPSNAREILETLGRWGVKRFSLSLSQPSVRRAFEQLCAWGCEVNLRDVPDLEGFLQAALLLPRSLTARFDSPLWRVGNPAASRASSDRPAPRDLVRTSISAR